MNPSLLVVIVNYRVAGLCIEALRSVAEEVRGMGGVRALLVDNASGDGSVERLVEAIRANGWESWSSVLPIDRNGGFAAGNNAALRLESERPEGSRANYVLLLNPDTVVRPGGIRSLLEFMADRPRVGIAGSRLENLDGRVQGSARRTPTPLGELESAARTGLVTRALRRFAVPMAEGSEPMRCDWVSAASMMVRADLFRTVGLLDEGYFLYFEETDFCLRASEAGWEVWFVPCSRVVHLEGASTGITLRRRRPAYWYASRRRFFLKAYGVGGWVRADCGWALGRLVWTTRQLLGLAPRGSDDPGLLAWDLLWGDARELLSGRWKAVGTGGGNGQVTDPAAPAGPCRSGAAGPQKGEAILTRVLDEVYARSSRPMRGCGRSDVEWLCPPKDVQDDSAKLLVRDREGRPSLVVLCSPLSVPDQVARAARAAAEARQLLGPELGSVVLEPVFTGEVEQVSYAALPYLRPMSERPIVSRIQDRLLGRHVLEWLRAATARTLSPIGAADLEEGALAPLRHLSSLPGLPEAVRNRARTAATRLESGRWRPQHVLMHGDLWRGNILLGRPGHGGPWWRGAFGLIDWLGSRKRGYAMYDLMRLALSFRMDRPSLLQEVRAHCRLLGCEDSDALGYLLAGLGDLGLRLGHFPIERYLELARRLSDRMIGLDL